MPSSPLADHLPSASTGHPGVHIVGTGLIGTSIGLALRRSGWPVTLEDASPTAAALARDLGAGDATTPQAPDLVMVATPPDVTAAVVARCLDRWPRAVVTDVASVKHGIIASLAAGGSDLSRFCGSHPMAGRERSGAVSGRADLFQGRAWVLTPTEVTTELARRLVEAVALAVGATVVTIGPQEHDEAVAVVSHVPQVVASLVAARLDGLTATSVGLAGQGLRDVTRIAASDPHLWTQILAGNAEAVASALTLLRDDLDGIVDALGQLRAHADAPGARAVLARAIAAGNIGHAQIPGKHGAAPTAYATVRVLIPDEPGQLGRLFADIGDIGTNIEEFHLDHGLGQAFGVAEIDVVPAAAADLTAALADLGWRLHS